MNKQKQIDGLHDIINELTKKLERELNANKILIEKNYRELAQIKRNEVDNSFNLFQKYLNIRKSDLIETAISILSWENLPKSFRFTSKRINMQLAKFGSVCIFKRDNQYLCLPFVGVSPIDCYNEFIKVKPFAPSPNIKDGESIKQIDYDFKELTVGVDCVIVSDYFNYGETNGNTSLTIEAAIELYCYLMADIETAKKTNRNWINFPLVFSYEDDNGVDKKSNFNKFINEVKAIVEGVSNHSNAIVSEIIKNLKVLPTETMYYGEQLEQTKKDYENELFNFLGIGVIRNETRERKITAEFEKTKDQYNINITKRLQNREQNIKDLIEVFGEEWNNVSIKVNLNEFTANMEEENDNNKQKTND